MHLLLPHSDLISALIIRFHDFLPFCTPSFLNRRNAFSPRFDPLCTYVKTKDSNKTILCICFFLYLLIHLPTNLPAFIQQQTVVAFQNKISPFPVSIDVIGLKAKHSSNWTEGDRRCVGERVVGGLRGTAKGSEEQMPSIPQSLIDWIKLKKISNKIQENTSKKKRQFVILGPIL